MTDLRRVSTISRSARNWSNFRRRCGMHRRSKIGALAAVVLVLGTLATGSGGSAAAPAASKTTRQGGGRRAPPAPSKPTRQQIARHLLAGQRPQFMTPHELAAVTMVANDSRALSPAGRNPAEGQQAETRAGAPRGAA